jgi:hypothetical protein
MVPKTSGRVGSTCLETMAGKELGTEYRLSKDAVTFYILQGFLMNFNGFCTILYRIYDRPLPRGFFGIFTNLLENHR